MITRYDYLELTCRGLTADEIAKMYGVTSNTVTRLTLQAGRTVGRMGFWKFYPATSGEIYLMRAEILRRLDRFGLTRREAA